jgi:hypothetical protein
MKMAIIYKLYHKMEYIMIKFLLVFAITSSLFAEDSFSDKWLKIQIVKEYVQQVISSTKIQISNIEMGNRNVVENVANPDFVRKHLLKTTDRKKELEFELNKFNIIYAQVSKEEVALRNQIVQEYIDKLNITIKVEKE